MFSSSVGRVETGGNGQGQGVHAYTSMVKRAIELAGVIGPAISSLPSTSAAQDSVGGQLMAIEDDQESSDSLEDGLDIQFYGAEIGEDLTTSLEGLNLHGAGDGHSNNEACEFEADNLMAMSSAMQPDGETALDSVVDSMIELTELLVSLKEAFSRSSRAEQEVLANQVGSLPGALEKFYSLNFDIFESEYTLIRTP